MVPLDEVLSGGLLWVPVSHKRGWLGKPKLKFRLIESDLVEDRLSENAVEEVQIAGVGRGPARQLHLSELTFGFGLRGTEKAEKETAGGSKCGRG
jgi:hypothetical protein